jgi:hypothetical protein
MKIGQCSLSVERAIESSGRQPAMGIANAGAVALVCHGQLTLTALVLRCERFPAK